ncbi:MAG: DUF6034 family protein [Peptococcaceae bacterium]|nr:DUF6034 family protein [Peptococcaceae bacterium]
MGSLPNTKQALLVLFILMLVLGFMSSCRETPSTSLLTGRGDPALEAAIERASNPTPVPYEAPDHLTESLGTHINTHIIVDADISVPNASQFPVIITTDDEISQETSDKIMAALLEGTTLHEVPSTSSTKEEIHQMIISSQLEFFAIAKATMPKEMTLAEYYEKNHLPFIKASEKSYISAPETLDSAELIPAETQFHPPSRHEQNTWPVPEKSFGKPAEQTDLVITGVAALPDGWEANLICNQRGYVSFRPRVPMSIMNITRGGYGLPIIGGGNTQQQAEDKAFEIIRKSGLDHLQLTGQEEGNIVITEERKATGRRPYFMFYFKNASDGIAENFATPYTPPFPLFHHTLNPEVCEYYSETAIVTVSDNKVVDFVWWRPVKKLEAKSHNVDLLPFEDVLDIFRNQIPVIYDNVYTLRQSQNPSNLRQRLHLVIHQIKLGMMQVPRYGHEGEYLIIPVWDFYGYDLRDYGGSDNMETNNSHDPDDLSLDSVHYLLLESQENSRYMSYLTINAIDGSIINRELGY